MIGTLLATVFTTKVVGQVDRSLFLWPVSAVALGLAVPHWCSGWKKRIALNLATMTGFLIGAVLVGTPWWFAAVLSLLTCIDMMLGRLILGPGIKGFEDLKRQSSILRFVILTVGVPALTGTLSAYPASYFLRQPVIQTAAMNILGNSLGFAVFFPLILFLRGEFDLGFRKVLPPYKVQATLSSAVFVGVTCFIFWQNRGPFLFMVFPPMVVVLLTMGLEGAVFTSLTLSVIGWVGTSHRHGPIWLMQGTSLEHLLALQAFVWVCLVTALPIGALLDERRRAESDAAKALEEKNQLLQEQLKMQEELAEANRQLTLLAMTDSLTGLSTRRVFESRAEVEYAVAKRNGRALSILVMDIDNFKQRNDTYGHAAGDEALKVLGTVVSACVRKGDVAARLGGEEFGFLLPETDVDGAMGLAERLQSMLGVAAHGPVPLTVSVGIATLDKATVNWEMLLSKADEAMYEAKRRGKNRSVHSSRPGPRVVVVSG
jgi:diguanylate cyclase (GGDEF)-like protein